MSKFFKSLVFLACSTISPLIFINEALVAEPSADSQMASVNAESSTTRNDAPDSILSRNNIKTSGFGGPSVRIGGVDSSFGVFSGAKGGFLFNDSFVIGGSGYGLLLPRFSDSAGESSLVGYGGILIEYIFMPKNLINFSVGSIIGAGGAFDTAFFVFEPELNVFVNITSYFKIGLSAAYRLTSGLNHPVLDDQALSGFSAGLQFIFGKF